MMKQVVPTIILKTLISHPSLRVFPVRQWPHVLVATELNLALNLFYYLYKKSYISTSCKEEVGVFVNISCLTQSKQKHLLRLQATTLSELQMLQFSTVQD